MSSMVNKNSLFLYDAGKVLWIKGTKSNSDDSMFLARYSLATLEHYRRVTLSLKGGCEEYNFTLKFKTIEAIACNLPTLPRLCSSCWGKGWASYQIFKKERLDSVSILTDEVAESFIRKIPATNRSSARKLCISKAKHSSLRHVRVGYKDKKPVSDFHQNIGVSCNSELKLWKFKDLSVKSTEKALQDEWMYVANAAKLWNFSRRFQLNYETFPFWIL